MVACEKGQYKVIKRGRRFAAPLSWVAYFARDISTFNEFFPCAVVFPSVVFFDAVSVTTFCIVKSVGVCIDNVCCFGWRIGVEVCYVG